MSDGRNRAALGMTASESAALDAVTTAARSVLSLPEERRGQHNDAIHALHVLQDYIAARPVWRAINAEKVG